MKRILTLCLCMLLLCGGALCDVTDPTQKEYFDARVSSAGIIEVPVRGPMHYYAQNDPMYRRVKYEARGDNLNRNFSTEACVPTALAIVLANLVPAEQLPKLGEATFKDQGYSFCVCSCSPFHCQGGHEQYRVTTVEEYLRYLPMVTGAYACGNGPKGSIFRLEENGTSASMYKPICDLFGLRLEVGVRHEQALKGLDEGAICVVSTGGEGSPFTVGSHFIVLAAYDEDYLYFLDPYIRKSYSRMDKNNVLEILSPGLVRARHSDLKNLHLSTYRLIYPPQAAN